MIRKIVSLVLSLCMLLPQPLSARAVGKAEIASYAEELIRYYYHYQDAAEDVIWDILNQMKAVDRDQAAVWRSIMEDWAWVNSGMPVSENVLPDGLPEDESLCIVVLGYGLNEDGSMKEELVDRLVVALASALKYPNASIAVTGGQTSPVEGVTEAGRMAAWLRQKGVEEKRLIIENQSLSTTANAVNVYKLLNREHPQISSIAIISSDYHIAWGSAMFAAVSNYKFGYEAERPIDVLAGAVCDTGKTMDTRALQAWGISTITGIPFDENSTAPALYPVDRPTEPAEVPGEITAEETEAARYFWEPGWEEPAVEEPLAAEEEKRSFVPVILIAVLGVAAYVLTPKRPSKRKRRKKPKIDLS